MESELTDELSYKQTVSVDLNIIFHDDIRHWNNNNDVDRIWMQ